jgi:signal peptidase I
MKVSPSRSRAGPRSAKRTAPLEGRHGAGRWENGFNGTAGKFRIIRRLNGHVAVDMRRLLSSMSIVLLVLLVFSRVFSVATGEPFPVSVISSDSMRPTLERGDIVVWAPTRMTDVHAGDIIVFKSAVLRNTVVAHRVVSVVGANGNLLFITKGDANADTDQAGLHTVEPPIGKKQYLGKVIGANGFPAKVPYLGLALFWSAGLQGDYFGEPGPSGYPWVLLPVIVAITIVLGAIWLMRPEPEVAKRSRAVFPKRRLSLRRTAVFALVAYCSILLLAPGSAPTDVTYVEAGIGVGVSFAGAGATRPHLYAEFLQPGELANASYLVQNPGRLPMNAIAYVEGDGAEFFSLRESVFRLEGNQAVWRQVDIIVPPDVKPGVYTARIRVFSSPLWLVLPPGTLAPLVAWNPMGAVILADLGAAFLFALVSLIGVALIAGLGSLSERRRVEGLAMREPDRVAHGAVALLVIACGRGLAWIRRMNAVAVTAGGRLLGVRAAEVRAAVLAGAVGGLVPLAAYFADGWSLLELALICAVSTGLAAVLSGCRCRSELVLATCISLGMMFGAVIAFPGMMIGGNGNGNGNTGMVALGHAVNVLALALILFLLFLIPVLLVARLTARLGVAARNRLRGEDGIEPGDL